MINSNSSANHSENSPKISRLPDSVVNKIAAGEVIQQPVNIVKNLLENALDAEAPQITVTLQMGGLKSILIQDNGHGISVDNFDLLCERFATSKLRDYSDLATIGSFGFRGEALASVSYVSHLTVTSRARNAVCAHKADYLDGKVHGSVSSCAGAVGTSLYMSDLFYNNPTRQQALPSGSYEHSLCVSLLQSYATHFPHITFVLNKHGQKLNTRSTRTIEQNLAAFYSNSFLTLVLFKMCNLPCVRLAQPIAINQLLQCHYCINSIDSAKRDLIEQRLSLVLEQSQMLWDFSVLIEGDIDKQMCVRALPVPLAQYNPNLGKLPRLIVALCLNVDWEEEQSCLHDLCECLANFYSVGHSTGDSDFDENQWKVQLANVIVPAIKRQLIPPKLLERKWIFGEVVGGFT